MKLVIVKGVYPDIDILDDEITLGVEDFSDYYKLLNDESLRETFYERYDDLGLYDSFLDYRAIRELPFGIDLDYFEETRLIVNDNSMGEDLKLFCESNSFPVILDITGLSFEGIKTVLNYDFKCEPKFNFKYNIGLTSHDELKETIRLIDVFKDSFDDNISPLEKMMFVYDYLKERAYNLGDDYEKSVSLSKVLKGDDIVCLGYAHLFVAILEALGIEGHIKTYRNENGGPGHATSLVSVNDDKYDFHGFLEFDLSSDARRNGGKEDFRKNYYYFGLAPLKYEERVKNMHLVSDDTDEYSLGKGLFERVREVVRMGADGILDGILLRKLERVFRKFNFIEGLELICKIQEENSLADNIDELEMMFEDLFSYSLSHNSFVKLLYFVRRSKHAFDPSKYEFNYDLVWNIAKRRLARDDYLAFLFSKDNERDIIMSMKELQSIPDNVPDKIQYDAKRMELVNVLRKEMAKKK